MLLSVKFCTMTTCIITEWLQLWSVLRIRPMAINIVELTRNVRLSDTLSQSDIAAYRSYTLGGYIFQDLYT